MRRWINEYPKLQRSSMSTVLDAYYFCSTHIAGIENFGTYRESSVAALSESSHNPKFHLIKERHVRKKNTSLYKDT